MRFFSGSHATLRSIVVGAADKSAYVFDIRRPDSPFTVRAAPSKALIRAVACLPDGAGFVLTTAAGRAAVEYYESAPAAAGKKSFAFKCHRPVVDGVEVPFPANAVAVHPKLGTLATGGGDGYVNTWDAVAKKRIAVLPAVPTSVSALAFNSTGALLVIASSYTFEDGDKPCAHPRHLPLLAPSSAHCPPQPPTRRAVHPDHDQR